MKKFKIGEEVKVGNTTGIIKEKKQESNGLWYGIKLKDIERLVYVQNKEIEKIEQN